MAFSIGGKAGGFGKWGGFFWAKNQRNKQNPPEAPKARPIIAPTTPRGTPKPAEPAMMNGLAGRKNKDPIARNKATSNPPRRPRLPTQVQRCWRAGMTGKK